MCTPSLVQYCPYQLSCSHYWLLSPPYACCPPPFRTHPQIVQDEDLRLRGVAGEVRRARGLRCSMCGRPGAAIGCRVPSCPRCFHLPCAIEAGARFNHALFVLACSEHAGLFSGESGTRGAASCAAGQQLPAGCEPGGCCPPRSVLALLSF
jgi:PHD-like zinc-binding domain